MKSEISINALQDPKRRKENEIKSFESISLCLISYFLCCVEIEMLSLTRAASEASVLMVELQGSQD